MKKYIKTIAFICCLLVLIPIFETRNIVTKSNKYSATSADKVSTRELALLASMVYEDVPDDSRYDGTTANQGCNVDKKTGVVTGKNGEDCHYIALEENSATNLKIKKSRYKGIWQYVEGMSERKINSAVSLLTSAFVENGQKYYWLNYADVTELDDWNVVHMGSKQTRNYTGVTTDFDFNGVFDAVTFKKGNNYVISFRGTDYPDLLEWIEDIEYSLTGSNNQAKLAYEYAQNEYKRIVEENSNAKIYVVGHSLGAYLAQVGGAAIVDIEAGRNVIYNRIFKVGNREIIFSEKSLDGLETLNDYTNAYKPQITDKSKLQQVAYFNGMGVSGVFSSSFFTKNIQNALIYLSTHDISGNVANTGRYVNYSRAGKTNIQSSGRLVLYSMDADPVSDIGLHLGEIYKLEVGADAIANHHKTHDNFAGKTLGWLLEQLLTISANPDKNITTEEMLTQTPNAIDDASSCIYNFIKSNQHTNGIFNFIPKVVSDAIEQENGNGKLKYGVGSLLYNLAEDVEEFQNKYNGVKINNLFDHFNMNHETDSFICLMDEGNNEIQSNQINLTISSPNMVCENNTCYSNKKYSFGGETVYSLGDDVNIKLKNKVKETTRYVILNATVNSGCAKSYDWLYSKDGNEYTLIGNTVRNEIIIPENYFNVAANGVIEGYFKVVVRYGDTYTETKIAINDKKNKFDYYRTTVNDSNPTNYEVSLNYSGKTTESAPITIKYVYDTKGPECSFEKKQTVEINYKKILGIKNYKDTKNRSLIQCEDMLSGFDNRTLNLNFNNFDIDKNTGTEFILDILSPIVSFDRKSNITTNIVNDSKTLGVYIPIIVKKKPTKYTAALEYKSGIKDKAGNTASVKNKILEYEVVDGDKLN